jgi:predicted nuclease of predicted toxin-antitoxin system
MKLFATIYTDEDVNVLIATLLRSRGIDAITTREQDMLGKSDDEQLAWAASTERCILTHNRVDFEELHLLYINEGRQHSGIIVIPRKDAYEITQRLMILLDGLTADEIANQLLYA